jgi:hypothetical protein
LLVGGRMPLCRFRDSTPATASRNSSSERIGPWLQERRPAHVRQVSKAGSSRPARKTYKLTTAGVNGVRAMLGRAPEAGED